MNNIKINSELYIENIDENSLGKLKEAHLDGNKMLEFALNDETLVENSCLKEFKDKFLKINFELTLCDNSHIHEINRDYRDKDSPTDVITFALFADAGENKIIFDETISLGEIIISTEKVKTQAIEQEKTFEYEFYFVLAHGILHLLGFDHLNEDDLNYMITTQEKMMENIDYD